MNPPVLATIESRHHLELGVNHTTDNDRSLDPEMLWQTIEQWRQMIAD